MVVFCVQYFVFFKKQVNKLVFGAQIGMQSRTFGYGAGSHCDVFSKTRATVFLSGRAESSFDLAF
jgi:hypothetical protein